MNFRRLAAIAAVIAFGGCSTTKESTPARTATELMLISSASDRGADQLAAQIPAAGKRVFVDTTYFDAPDGKYAIAAIRGALARRGALLTAREQAELVVEIRVGALSVDEHSIMLGVPSIPIPSPLTGAVSTPEIAIFKKHELQAVAKFGATTYDPASGRPLGGAEPKFETAERTDYVALLLISWTHDTTIPKPDRD